MVVAAFEKPQIGVGSAVRLRNAFAVLRIGLSVIGGIKQRLAVIVETFHRKDDIVICHRKTVGIDKINPVVVIKRPRTGGQDVPLAVESHIPCATLRFYCPVGHVVQCRGVDSHLVSGISPTVGAHIHVSRMVGKDAAKKRVTNKINGRLVPRLAAVQSPIQYVTSFDEQCIVGNGIHGRVFEMGIEEIGAIAPGVATVIGNAKVTLVVRQVEDAPIWADGEAIEMVVVGSFQNYLPCFALVLRTLDSGFADKQIAVGGHAF